MTDQLKPVLEVKNVSKFFGGVEALKQGSLKLFPGEVLNTLLAYASCAL